MLCLSLLKTEQLVLIMCKDFENYMSYLSNLVTK